MDNELSYLIIKIQNLLVSSQLFCLYCVLCEDGLHGRNMW